MNLRDELKDFISEHERIIKGNRKLYLNKGSNTSGYFQYEDMEIGTPGINLEMLKEIEEKFKSHTNQLNYKELMKKRDTSEHIEIPGVKDFLVHYQTISHEAYHMLQSLTLQASGEYVYWLRQIKDWEFMTFATHLYGGKWMAYSSILEAGYKLIDDSWLIKEIIQHKMRLSILDNFNFNNDRNGILSPLEIAEGSACAFQEIITRCIGMNICDYKKEGLYTKAYQCYLERGGDAIKDNLLRSVIFLFICHVSLRYGSSDEFHPGGDIDSPVFLFEHLCKNISKYHAIFGFQLVFCPVRPDHVFGIATEGLNQLSADYLRNISDRLDKEAMCSTLRLIKTLREMESDIKNYFDVNKFSWLSRPMKHLDRKRKPIFDYLVEKFPLFDSLYFIAFLISDIKLSRDFILMAIRHDKFDGMKVKNLLYREEDANSLDTLISKTMADLKQFIETGATYCCEKHGKDFEKKRVIMKCNEPDSLRNRIKMFGNDVELKKTVIF